MAILYFRYFLLSNICCVKSLMLKWSWNHVECDEAMRTDCTEGWVLNQDKKKMATSYWRPSQSRGAQPSWAESQGPCLTPVLLKADSGAVHEPFVHHQNQWREEAVSQFLSRIPVGGFPSPYALLKLLPSHLPWGPVLTLLPSGVLRKMKCSFQMAAN